MKTPWSDLPYTRENAYDILVERIKNSKNKRYNKVAPECCKNYIVTHIFLKSGKIQLQNCKTCILAVDLKMEREGKGEKWRGGEGEW